MRAVLCTAYEDHDALEVGEAPSRAPGPGEVRIDDHLKGTWSASWEFSDGIWLHQGQYNLTLHMDRRGSDKSTPAAFERRKQRDWKRVFRALEGCG